MEFLVLLESGLVVEVGGSEFEELGFEVCATLASEFIARGTAPHFCCSSWRVISLRSNAGVIC